MKKCLLPVVCFIVMVSFPAHAAPPPHDVREPGVEVSHIAYREPGLMSQRGVMYGILYSHTFLSDTQAKLEAKLSTGRVKYTGSLQDENSTPVTVSGIPDVMFEIRGLWGFLRPQAPFFQGPYAGLGYRYLYDDTSYKSESGYLREANYYYVPIGYEHAFLTETDAGWRAGFNVEYDWFLFGRQVSHLGDVDPGLGNITNKQHDGYGYRASLKFRKSGESLEFTVEPYVRYWNIARSDISSILVNTDEGLFVLRLVEPANDSTELGVKFLMRY